MAPVRIHIEIDCTPEEARRFFGLPDVGPVQAKVMEALEQRLTEAVRTADATTLMDQWLPLTLKGLEQWQAFWTEFARAAGSGAEATAKGQGSAVSRERGSRR